MSHQDETVDRIRAFLGSDDQTMRDGLADLAREYARACEEVNLRLGRCHRLLQQGLRSEAIQLAEIEPNVLDTLRSLDLPARNDWDGVCDLYGLSRAPALAIAAGEALNDAYAEEEPLKAILRRHRRLALMRAPLPVRIELLRQIAPLDPGNSVWADDLRTYERARLQQIEREIADAAARGDGPRLEGLSAELSTPGWSESPPEALVNRIGKLARQGRLAGSRREMEALDSSLCSAWSAGDALTAREVRARWERALPAAELSPGDPLLESARPVFQWLDEIERREEEESAYDEAVQDLDDGLATSNRLAELQRLGHAVLQFGRGIPAELLSRYGERHEVLTQEEKRRNRLVYIAAGTAAALLVALGLLFVRQQMFAREVAKTVASVEAMLDEGKLEEVADRLGKIDAEGASISFAPEVLELRARLTAQQREDVQRQAEFESLVRQIEAADALVKDVPSTPRARTLARTARERGQLDETLRRRSLAYQAELSRRETTLRAELDKLAPKLTQLENLVEESKDLKLVERVASEAEGALAKLAAEIPPVSSGLLTSARTCRSRLEAVRKDLSKLLTVSRAEEAMSAALKRLVEGQAASAVEYVSALGGYEKALAGNARAESFRKAVAEGSTWEAFLAYGRMVDAWPLGPSLRDPKVAVGRVADIRRLVTTYPVLSRADGLQAYLKAAESVARRVDGDPSLTDQLRKYFADSLLDNLYVLDIHDFDMKKRYYLFMPYMRNADSMKYIVDFDGTTKESAVVEATVEFSGRAPQSAFADEVRDSIRAPEFPGVWESRLLDLAWRIRNDASMDPLLKCAIINKLFSLAAAGSEPLREILAPRMRTLADLARQSSVPWMDPENEDALRARPKVKRELEAVADWRPHLLQPQIDLRRADLEHRVTRVPRPFGWLVKESSVWQCRNHPRNVAQGELVVLLPSAHDGTNTGLLCPVGRVREGRASIDESHAEALLEGRLVFLVPGPSRRS